VADRAERAREEELPPEVAAEAMEEAAERAPAEVGR
jgi:hypothetical protein